ncbi:MAG: metal-dependent hydrolase [Acidobacteriota bacterium]
MDPFSHLAFGRTLAALPTRRPREPGTILAVMLGALAPDVDAVLMPAGWDIYLRAHEIGTHSLLGSLGIAVLTAVIVRVLIRGGRFQTLVPAAWAGSLSHLALDILSGAQIRLGWPLTDVRTSLPLVAMAEPVLMAIFVVGMIVLIAVRNSPARRQRFAAVGVLTAAFLFLDIKAVLLFKALSPLGGRPREVVYRAVEARWASLTEWYVYERTASALQQQLVRAGGGPELLLSWPIVAESALVTSSRSLSTVRNFLRVHELGFAVQRPDPIGGTQVLWSDIRFCGVPDRTADTTLPVASVTTSAGRTDIACGLWFGGTFDGNGRVVSQRLLVGQWEQNRGP